MKIIQALVVYSLLAVFLGGWARSIYLDDHYYRYAPRTPNPSTGTTFPATVHHGVQVYLTESEWLWFGSPEYGFYTWCTLVVAAVSAIVLNRRWKVL